LANGGMEEPKNNQRSAPKALVQPLVCSLCFLFALVITCLVIGRYLPFPDVSMVRPKLDWLGTQGDSFDVIFIGSSRVAQQIIPSVFDQTAAALGAPVRSYNAGIPAMVPPEDSYLLEQVLQHPHHRLRWALIELMPLGGQFDPMLEGTERTDYWHDSRRMWLLTKRAAVDCVRFWQERAFRPQTWRELCRHTIESWCSHLKSFAARTTNYGRGASLLASHLHGRRKPSRYDDGGPTGDGWVDPGGLQFMEGDRLVAYESQFAAARDNPRVHSQDGLSEESLAETIELLRRHGVGTILFLPPTLAPSQFYPARLLESVPLFDLSDIARHPELYAASNHRDGVHLNLDGARIFTRELATLFAGVVRPVSQ
jgi:hypothetical protein